MKKKKKNPNIYHNENVFFSGRILPIKGDVLNLLNELEKLEGCNCDNYQELNGMKYYEIGEIKFDSTIHILIQNF